jgi:hypothetical protein
VREKAQTQEEGQSVRAHQEGKSMTITKAKRPLLCLPALLTVALFVLPSAAWANEPFGIAKFETTIINAKGEPATLAGSHPYALTTTIEFANHKTRNEEEKEVFPSGVSPNGDVNEVEVGFPAGMVVNPNATRVKCTEAELDARFECPSASAVGVAANKLAIFVETTRVPVFNMVPPPGVPAELGFEIGGIVVHIYGGVRTGGDYGVSGRASDILQKGALYDTSVTLWGDPTAESHDSERGVCVTEPADCPVAVERTGVSLLTMPTACPGSPLVSTVRADSWEEPDRFVDASAASPAVSGCEALGFGPTLMVQPSEPAAPATESPVGLEVDLKIPQEEGLERVEVSAKSDLKEAIVTLPTGVIVSPSAANGLGACPLLSGREPRKEKEEEKREVVGINLESKQSANCPDSSKLGSVEVITPLLEVPLKGSVFLAQQGNLAGNGSNPYGSLFALYLVAEGSGVVVKLPGKIELDPTNGQLTARFGEDPVTGFFLPQLPFSEMKMHFFGGPRAPLVTPSSCGTYTTTSRLTPWDGNGTVEPGSSFKVTAGCGPRDFAPTLTAGTTNPQAGGFSDETVTIARNNGEQDLSGIALTTPPGLLGLLSKVSLCQEPQASQGTCSEASEIGEATEALGPGEDPYWVKGGRVYLTGPYDHEPFGLSVVNPTTAGPFTLIGEHGGPGKEVTRASIAVNPKTDALTITSEPLPTILEGVPLDVRTINVDINRNEFTFNPTSCEELHVTSSITSTEGATATPSSRFQAANCAALPFKPSFAATTQGNSSDIGNGASLNVKVGQKAGEAAIRSVYLELPKKLPARLHTLQKACTEATFDTNPANCPSTSDVGTAIAHTPVLPVPLEGPGYFVSHGGAQYPELVFVLQGDGVTIDLAGETHINSKTKITSSTFGTVPDAPITSFEANLPEGPDSALAGITPKGVCGSASLSMPTTIVGQNGAQVKQTTKVAITGCSKKKHKKPVKPKGKGKKSSRRR